MTPPDRDAVLRVFRASRVLARMPAEALGLLAEMVREDRYAAGETIWRRGDTADDVVVVAAGRIDVHPDEGAPAVRSLRPGDLLGEYGMVGERRRTATVRAAEETVVYSVDTRRFRSFLESAPASLFVLFESSVLRLLEAEARLRDRGSRS